MSDLARAVERFSDALAPVLVGLSKPPAQIERLRHDVIVEAFALACGFLNADGRQTDDELWELIAAFGPHLDTELGGAAPGEVRR